jgi:hypothetical protein
LSPEVVVEEALLLRVLEALEVEVLAQPPLTMAWLELPTLAVEVEVEEEAEVPQMAVQVDLVLFI